MTKIQNKETRYYIDIDIKHKKIIKYDFEQREILKSYKINNSNIYRVFLTKGQYNKLIENLKQYQ